MSHDMDRINRMDPDERDEYWKEARAERERCRLIYTSPEAVGREALANAIMFNTNLSIKEARQMLSMAAKETPKIQNFLAQAMAQVPNPKIGADCEDAAPDSAEGQAELLARQVMGAGKSNQGSLPSAWK